MLKKLSRSLLAILLLLSAAPMWAQWNGIKTQVATFTTAGGTGSTAPMATGNTTTNKNVGMYQLIWTGSGTRSTCTVQIKAASTATGSYSTIGSSQTCTSDGTYTFYLAPASTNAWIELNVSAITGSGNTVKFVMNAFPSTPLAPQILGSLVSSNFNNCGSSASCATPALVATPLTIDTGTVTFSAATTASITGLVGFTSATSYSCSISNQNAHTYTSGSEVTSATAVTFLSGTSNSDSWTYTCIGY
jgi:hypothetical protein